MTRKFAEQQLSDLRMYLDAINADREGFEQHFGRQWLIDKIDEILDEINHYEAILKKLNNE